MFVYLMFYRVNTNIPGIPTARGQGVTMELVTRSLSSCEEFESKAGLDWAREIIVDYYTRTEEGWLLGCMVKVLSVTARHNPCQGGLSHSFLLEVQYKIGAKLSREAWFVKVPKSLQTVAMDQRELVMYNKIFPRLQVKKEKVKVEKMTTPLSGISQ